MQYLKVISYILSIFLLFACATQQVSVITGTNYDEKQNVTKHMVLPYGSVEIPGKWEKKSYDKVSHQQFFENKDSIELGVAFGNYKKLEFNFEGKLKGLQFALAYHDWEATYFKEKAALSTKILEKNEIDNYLIYKLFGKIKDYDFNTYFLIAERNGNYSNFTISTTEKWTEEQKVKFLKNLYFKK